MKRLFIITFFLVIILSGIAGACPMCQGGQSEKTIIAYKTITALLMCLPLGMGFGLFWWMRRRIR